MLLSFTQFIGRFHPLLVHLPIGILLMALALQWLSRKEQYTLSYGLMKVVWLSGTFAALLSSITGYLLSLDGDYDEVTVSLHMWMGIGVTAVSLLICARVFARKFDIIYRIAVVLLLILIFATGHFGGSLTHGADYLGFSNQSNAPTTPAKNITNIQEANVYADVVQPILQTKCYNCHSSRKQKGGLRMDDSAHIMKGGKDGIVVVAGKADESEMIKRLLLPREEENHMPPKEKPQLNEQQIALLHWWVSSGAAFSKKVKELPQPEKIQPVLVSLQNSGHERLKTAYVPYQKVEPADTASLKILKAKGIVVLPVAQESSYLLANFVTASGITNEVMKALSQLKKQLIWLKLSDTKINDSDLVYVAQCDNLRILQLNNTAISDNGLGYLKALDSLQSLSVVGTQITYNGLKSLHGLKNLKQLYLFGTGVTSQEIASLKKIFPKTIIDTGGYTLQVLSSDTSIIQAPKK